MTNDDIMKSLLENKNFSELSYNNNILTYQGKSIDLSNLFLNDFFNDSYSPLILNQNIITAEDLFNIFELHTKEIELNNNEISLTDLANIALNKLTQEENKKIINVDKYFELIGSKIDDYSATKIRDFETEVSQCMKYSDYLLDDKKQFIDDYKNKMFNITFQSNEQDSPELTIGQKYAIKKYNEIAEDAKNFMLQKEKQKQRIRAKAENINVSYGYANAFIVLLSTIAVGIIAALVLYFTIK